MAVKYSVVCVTIAVAMLLWQSVASEDATTTIKCYKCRSDLNNDNCTDTGVESTQIPVDCPLTTANNKPQACVIFTNTSKNEYTVTFRDCMAIEDCQTATCRSCKTNECNKGKFEDLQPNPTHATPTAPNSTTPATSSTTKKSSAAGISASVAPLLLVGIAMYYH